MKIIRPISIIIPILILFLWAIRFTSPTLRIEGYKAFAYSLLSEGEATKYADGYTHQKYLQIEKGMTSEEVKSILGHPLNEFTYKPGQKMMQIIWSYSKRYDDGDYRTRQIRFLDGKVYKVFGGYYLD